jgi:hypothetical protein
MITETPPRSSALSSEFGWGSTDEGSTFGGVGSAVLLLVSSGAYLASVWLAYGLPPLHQLALRVRSKASKPNL